MRVNCRCWVTLLGKDPFGSRRGTHPGEEGIVIQAHQTLRERYPDLLTVIAPRHPARGNEIAAELRAANAEFSRRSLGEAPQSEVYLADTLGELGLLYRLSSIAFIGGSMNAHGGHNPVEAADWIVPLFTVLTWQTLKRSQANWPMSAARAL